MILINAYSTLRDAPAPDFPHELHGTRGLDDPELTPHLNGFMRYVVEAGDGQMNAARYATMRHIQRVRHQYVFGIEDDARETYSDWARRANAISYLPDGSVRDADGKVLVSPDASAVDTTAQVPYPADAWKRKERSEALLAKQKIQILPSLPPIVDASEVVLRDAADVARRTLALALVALRAEGIHTNDSIPVAHLAERCPLGYEALSPKELAFMLDEAPSEQDVCDFSWRYEALFALQWTLGWHRRLTPATDLCNVRATVDAMLEHNAEEAIAAAQLRPVDEILDALDVHWRMHWAVRQARIDKKEMPGKLDAGVIAERHYAFNWLIGFEARDWDDVDTPT